MGTDIKSTVLIIEDDAGFRRIYQDMFEKEGYDVLVAEDGESGLQITKRDKPDIVLLDLILPGMHGFEVLQRIRNNDEISETPVLIMTALGDQEDVKRGLDLGANDYTVKGFYTPRDVLRRARSLLAQVEMKKGITSYRLLVQETGADAARLQRDLGMTSLFKCSHCQGELVLELLPDYTRPDSHWFKSRFICPKCREPF